MYTRQLLIVTLIVFNKILSTIIVGLRIFPLSISIILTSLGYSTLTIVIILVIVKTLISLVNFYIVKADIPFLLYLADIDRL